MELSRVNVLIFTKWSHCCIWAQSLSTGETWNSLRLNRTPNATSEQHKTVKACQRVVPLHKLSHLEPKLC